RGDFAYPIAAALDLHPSADLHAQALDLVHVVQSGISHRGPADQYWCQHGHWRKLAGTPYLHTNVFQLRDPRPCRVFVRYGPAWSLAGEAEFVLQRDPIDFYDDAVDLIRQGIALAFPLLDEIPRLVHAVNEFPVE